MSKEIIVAIIAFVGVIMSITSSFYTSSKQISNELYKFKLENQKVYSDKLLAKRLDIYPGIYFLLSDFGKKIDSGNFTRNDMALFFRQMNKWNSNNSLIFSGHTGLASYHLRETIRQLLKMDNKAFVSHFDSSSARLELKSRFTEFELGLKSDIGIYDVEFSDVSNRFKSYESLNKQVTTEYRGDSPRH